MKEVKEFLNKMVEEGKEFATSSPDWFVDILSSSRKKDHIAKSSQFQRMNKSQKNRHNKYVMALEDLLGSAQYLNPSPNKKPLEKPNTEQYHYFISEAKIGDKTYKILFDTEEYKGDSTIKPQTVHLYDVQEVKNSSSGANDLMSVKNPKEESNTIITDNREDFNPMINNNVQNWNEADHPRGETGKFTGKGGVKTQLKSRLINLPEVQKHLRESIKAQKLEAEYDKRIPQVGDTAIDSDRLLSNFIDKLTSEEYKNFNWEEFEDALFDELNKLEKEEGFKSEANNINNNKEQEMALIDELKKLITKVENNKEQEMTEKIENEKVDKRDIIRQIMAIAGKHEDNEDVRTIAKLAEKLAYDKSEAGTADNVCDDEEEEVKNKKVKNEETGKDKDFINRELNKGNLLYKKTGVSNREASIASKVDILPDNIITDIQEDFNPMIMGAYISNIIKIIPVVILNLFLKK